MLGAALLALTPAMSKAQVVGEVGDAGESLATAQVIIGSVTTINGTLINLGNADHNVDDIDLYRITIVNPAAFSVSVTSDMTADDDSQLFLFDSGGVQLAFVDDAPYPYPKFAAGDFAGLAAGTYFLGFNLFATQTVLSGGVLTGWDRHPAPFQTGEYTLSLTGTGGAAVDLPPGRGGVPEPASWALMILGFGAAGSMFRQRAAATAAQTLA